MNIEIKFTERIETIEVKLSHLNLQIENHKVTTDKTLDDQNNQIF